MDPSRQRTGGAHADDKVGGPPTKPNPNALEKTMTTIKTLRSSVNGNYDRAALRARYVVVVFGGAADSMEMAEHHRRNFGCHDSARDYARRRITGVGGYHAASVVIHVHSEGVPHVLEQHTSVARQRFLDQISLAKVA